MTRKHYLILEVTGGLADIYDNITEDSIMNVNEAVDKLNQLTIENNMLKQENQILQGETFKKLIEYTKLKGYNIPLDEIKDIIVDERKRVIGVYYK